MPGVPFEELVAPRGRGLGRPAARTEAVRFYRAGVDAEPALARRLVAPRPGPAPRRAATKRRATPLRRVVRLKPGAGPGWTLLGLTEFRLGSYDQAFADLSRGIALGVAAAPEVGQQGLHALTLLLIRRGDFSTPSKNLAILVRLEPDDPELRRARAVSLALRRPELPSEVPAGRPGGRGGRRPRRVRGLRRAHRRGPPRVPGPGRPVPAARGVHFAYGLVLSGEGSPEALPMLRREVELFPDYGEAHLEIAFDSVERGNPAEALPPARIAARLLPESPWSHLALGRALLATGGVEEAAGRARAARARSGPR